MLSFFKKLFGAKPAETVAEVPYKVETPVAETTPFPVEAKPAKAKKPAVKKATTKPRKPKAPK